MLFEEVQRCLANSASHARCLKVQARRCQDKSNQPPADLGSTLSDQRFCLTSCSTDVTQHQKKQCASEVNKKAWCDIPTHRCRMRHPFRHDGRDDQPKSLKSNRTKRERLAQSSFLLTMNATPSRTWTSEGVWWRSAQPLVRLCWRPLSAGL